jgi:GT2 family glycosyltransferase
MNRVALVVLNWNGINDTLRCLDSLISQDYKNFKIVVVDNGSIDDSVQKLEAYKKRTRSDIIILANQKNLGFAGGVNVGISYALKHKFDSIALFNNDATADKSWLSHLVASLRDSEVGVATGLLLRAGGRTIDSTGEFYTTWGLSFPRNRDDSIRQIPEAGPVFAATGGASLYRSRLFGQIGLFDESFFAYYEDVDVSFRAQLAGWGVCFNPEAIAYHKQGATSKKLPGFTVYQTFKNLPLLFLKDVPGALLVSIGLRFYLAYWLMLGNAIKNGDARPALKGLFASFFLGFGALAKRYHIQKSKTVSTEHIKQILWDDLPPNQTGMRKFRHFFLRNRSV